MRVTDNRKNNKVCIIEELKSGTIFEFSLNSVPLYFIRTSLEHEQGYDILCIDIETGDYRYFSSKTKVQPVNAEVIIN